MTRRIYGSVLLLLLAVFVPPTHAAVFNFDNVDPGAIGDPSNSPILQTFLNPNDAANDVGVEFVFPKHVEAERWGFAMTPVLLDPATLTGIEWDFWLTDMSGAEIPDTRSTGGEQVSGAFTIDRFPDPGSGPVIAHDVHYQFNWNPNAILFATVDVIVDGQVGLWDVPEPTTFVIWSLLGLTMTGACRWRQRSAA